MNIGIIGLPATGKTTLFNLLTGAQAETHRFAGGESGPNIGVTVVPDPRLDSLRDIYQPKKTIHATLDIVDVAGMIPGAAKEQGFSPQLLAALRNVDALVHVVRDFDDATIPHPAGSLDPARDVESVELELMLADLTIIEKRLENMEVERKKKGIIDKGVRESEMQLLSRLKGCLENEKPLRNVDLSFDEKFMLRGFTFLSLKPSILVLNRDEHSITFPEPEPFVRLARQKRLPYLSLSARIEEEISQMTADEAGEFLCDLGIDKPARDRLIRLIYESLQLIPFFTVGKDECRAWTITSGDTAHTAAGKIHSDLARGFIRAEVVAFDHLIESGSWAAAKAAGHLRLEGRDYLVQDGDCLEIRFSV